MFGLDNSCAASHLSCLVLASSHTDRQPFNHTMQLFTWQTWLDFGGLQYNQNNQNPAHWFLTSMSCTTEVPHWQQYFILLSFLSKETKLCLPVYHCIGSPISVQTEWIYKRGRIEAMPPNCLPLSFLSRCWCIPTRLWCKPVGIYWKSKDGQRSFLLTDMLCFRISYSFPWNID